MSDNIAANHDIDVFLAAPPAAQERLIIDMRAKSTLCQEAEIPWPKTAVYGRRRGERWVYELPPGVHVPCETIGRGIMIQGCDAQFALCGCEPTDRSDRQLALAPEQLLKRFAVPVAPTATKTIDPTTSPGDAIPPAPADDTVATDAKSAPGGSTGADDGNGAQRSPREGGEVSGALCGPVAPAAPTDNVVPFPTPNQSGSTKPNAPERTRFELFAHNGFGPLLLPAGHPEWPVSLSSTIKGSPAKIPAELWGNGYCSGFRGWNRRPAATPQDLREWQQMGAAKGMPANVSLRTGTVLGAPFFCSAVDIDVECPVLAPKIIAMARTCLGHSPRRTRAGSPRALLPYRVTKKAAALGKIPLKFIDKNGGQHLVEILLSGSGPQFIADGLHPRGARYEWPDGYPVASDLPEIGETDIRGFTDALEELLQEEGCTLVAKGSTRHRTSQKYQPISYKPFMAPSHDTIAEALKGFPNTPENVRTHDDFVQMTAAIKAAAGHESFYPEFETWAMEYPGIEPDYVQGRWNSIRETVIGWPWLCQKTGYAANSGFADETKGVAASASTSNRIDPTDLWATDASTLANLPVGAVPEIVERAARDKARKLGVEAGALAAGLLTALGSLIPASNRLLMLQNTKGWDVRSITWTMILGEPGSNKSAIVKWAKEPVEHVEREWRREYAVAKHKFEREKQKEKTDGAETESVNDLVVEPHCGRKIIEDITVEEIAVLLSKHPDGLFCHQDELAALFGSMDAYRSKGGKDRPFWLKAKEGYTHNVDRRGRDSIFVECVAVSVLGGIQPTKLQTIATDLASDGTLQRFLPVFVKRTGTWLDEPDNADLEESLKRLAVAIANSETKCTYRFSPEAHAELESLEDFKTQEINRPDASPAMRQWLDKLPNEFGRFAFIFHVVDWLSTVGSVTGESAPELISRDIAGMARRYLTEFAFSHAQELYESQGITSQADEDAKWIARHILTHGRETIERREIARMYSKLRKLKSAIRDSRITEAMSVLEIQGWASPTRENRGKDTAWLVNPAVRDGRFAGVGRAKRAG